MDQAKDDKLTMESPEIKGLPGQSEALDQKYQGLVITTEEQYASSAKDFISVGEFVKTVKARWKKILKPLMETKTEVDDFFGPIEDRAKAIELMINTTMTNWRRERDRIHKEEEQRAEEEAKKERKKLLDKAQKAASKGNDSESQKLQQAAEAVDTTPIIHHAAPKTKGVTELANWQFKVTDKTTLLKYLIKNKLFNLIAIDDKELRKIVKGLKDNFNYPGVKVWNDAKTKRTGR